MYNRVPNRTIFLTPIKLPTNTCSDHHDLPKIHIHVCPSFLFGLNHQDFQKIPSCYCNAQMGQYLGFFNDNSSFVANVKSLRTGFVSPKFLVIFDDLFQTVFVSGEDEVWLMQLVITILKAIEISMP